ncbi:MAG: hypothetical protein HZA01_07270 [Nitrospinae bacterium]|nr:hypothetical protein [Nitrospinota bacterium]
MDALCDDLKKLTGEDETPENPFQEKGEANEEQGDGEIDKDDSVEDEEREQEDREFSMKKLFQLPVEVASVGRGYLKVMAERIKANLETRGVEPDTDAGDSVTLKKLLDTAPDEIKKELLRKMAELGTLFYFTLKDHPEIKEYNSEMGPLLEALDQMIEIEEKVEDIQEEALEEKED